MTPFALPTMPPGTPRWADLHTHTLFSDGVDTPQRLVELAHAAGLSVLALTDHDETGGIAQVEAAAAPHGMTIIPGIEMSASTEDVEVHILGYYFDRNEPGLRRHLAEQKARRIERVKEMVRRLQRVGLAIEAEEVFALAGKDGTVGRPHVAQALVQRGHVATRAEAFDRYLGPDGPGFVPGSPLPPRQIIEVLRGAGGVPVLAHPVYLKRDDLIPKLVDDGMAGLEVYHPGHAPDLIAKYDRLADTLHVLKTGGSDYHGTAKEGAPLGAVRIPVALVETLQAWHRAHQPTRAS